VPPSVVVVSAPPLTLPSSPRHRTAAGHRSPRLVEERRRRSGFSPPPRRRGAPVSYRLHPHARWVASPPWVLERHRLLHICRCSTAAGHAATRPESRAHGPSRRCGRGPCALCNWAERRFGPVAFDYIFIFSEYIQFLANSKICVVFI
jgi:hypothetical protein